MLARSALEKAGADLALRVLFVQSQTEIGGAETSLLPLVRAIDRDRLEPAVAVLGFGEGDLPHRLHSAGCEVLELRSGRLRNPIGWIGTVLSLRKFASKGGFAALIANGYHPHLYAHPAAVLARVPSVVFCHDFPHPRGHGSAIERVSFAFRAMCYLVPSGAMAQAVRDRTGGRAPVVYVPNGVDASRFRAQPLAGRTLRAELGLSPGDLVITIVGRLQPWKGQHVFLEAAALVAREIPEARFLVVGDALFGQDLDYPRQLREQAGRLGIGQQTVFAGNRSDMVGVYSASDIVVHCSVKPEPFGVVIVEAMASGCPVVVSRAGGAAELYEEGVSGFGVEPGNVEDAARCIVKLCRDGVLRASLGVAARYRIEQRYSASHAGDALAEAMETLLRPGRDPWSSSGRKVNDGD